MTCALTRPTLERVVERPEPTAERPQGMCLDAGYDYDEDYAIPVEPSKRSRLDTAEMESLPTALKGWS